MRGKGLEQVPGQYSGLAWVDAVVVGVGRVLHFPFGAECGVEEIETGCVVAAAQIRSVIEGRLHVS